jgi:hypothetical protein
MINKKLIVLNFFSFAVLIVFMSCNYSITGDKGSFPDGSPVSPWFSDTTPIKLNNLGNNIWYRFGVQLTIVPF